MLDGHQQVLGVFCVSPGKVEKIEKPQDLDMFFFLFLGGRGFKIRSNKHEVFMQDVSTNQVMQMFVTSICFS